MLNELSSPYGDCDQKLAYYFLQALFCKATESGNRCYKSLISVADKSHCFDSARKLILKFQEVSPWTTFGHVASNGAILEAFDGENKLHIIDISNTLCTQCLLCLKLWPQEGEAIAVNCIGALRRVEVEDRGDVIRLFSSLNPRIVTVVEEEADFTSSRSDFVKCFEECLRYYTLYFEMLEESFTPTSNERLMLERECSRGIVRVLTCDDEQNIDSGDCERREKGNQWCERLKEHFSLVGFSDDVVDDVKALLKRYRTGWSLAHDQTDSNADSGMMLAWKDEPVVWASAWKP
ncbi:putative transcription factor GRAS family [Helianthus annuus]|nr:putative transcription factor GRAS family [Helianthus annuus]